MLRKFPGKEGT